MNACMLVEAWARWDWRVKQTTCTSRLCQTNSEQVERDAHALFSRLIVAIYSRDRKVIRGLISSTIREQLFITFLVLICHLTAQLQRFFKITTIFSGTKIEHPLQNDMEKRVPNDFSILQRALHVESENRSDCLTSSSQFYTFFFFRQCRKNRIFIYIRALSRFAHYKEN